MAQAALAGDIATLLEREHHDGLMHILALTHTGMTTDDFDARVNAWLASAKHPRFDKPCDQLTYQLTYQPMQELLRYPRTNGFSSAVRAYASFPKFGPKRAANSCSTTYRSAVRHNRVYA